MNPEIRGRIRALARWIALILALAASPAYAAYICPNGPGPGEIQVGATPVGGIPMGVAPAGGGASIPVCEANGYAQSAAPSPPPPRRLPDVYMAVVTHPDTSKVWPAVGYSRQKAASNAALDACRQAMGEGCQVAQA